MSTCFSALQSSLSSLINSWYIMYIYVPGAPSPIPTHSTAVRHEGPTIVMARKIRNTARKSTGGESLPCPLTIPTLNLPSTPHSISSPIQISLESTLLPPQFLQDLENSIHTTGQILQGKETFGTGPQVIEVVSVCSNTPLPIAHFFCP